MARTKLLGQIPRDPGHPSPGFGIITPFASQTHWGDGGRDDRENDGDDLEPDDLGGDSRE